MPGITVADAICLGRHYANWDVSVTNLDFNQWEDIATRSPLADIPSARFYSSSDVDLSAAISKAHGNATILDALTIVPDSSDALEPAVEAIASRYPHSYIVRDALRKIHAKAADTVVTLKLAGDAARCAPKSAIAWIDLADAISDAADSVRKGKFFGQMSDADAAYVSGLYPDWTAADWMAAHVAPDMCEPWIKLSGAALFDGDDDVADVAFWNAQHIDPTNSSVYSWGLQMYQSKWRYGAEPQLAKVAGLALQQKDPSGQLSWAVINAILADHSDSPALQATLWKAILVSDHTILQSYLKPSDWPVADWSAVQTDVKACVGRPDAESCWTALYKIASNRAQQIRVGRVREKINATEWRSLYRLYDLASFAAQLAVCDNVTDGQAWTNLAKAATFAYSEADGAAALMQALLMSPDNIDAEEWGLEIYQPKWGGTTAQLVDLVTTISADPTNFELLSPHIVTALVTVAIPDQQTIDLLAKARSAVADLTADNKKDAAAMLRLASYYGDQNRIDDQLAMIKASLTADPNNADAHHTWGTILFGKGDRTGAIDQYKQALQIDPENAGALGDLTWMLASVGSTDEAIVAARQFIALDPDRADAHYLLAFILDNASPKSQSEADEAKSEYAKASDLDPTGVDEGDDARKALGIVGATTPGISPSAVQPPAVVAWNKLGSKAQDIGIGANGSIWVSATPSSGSSSSVYQWISNSWKQEPGEGGRIAVDPKGNAWVVTAERAILRWNGVGWDAMPGQATDIGIGANGDVWVIGVDSQAGGSSILKWNGAGWNQVEGGATRIAVDPSGYAWVANSYGMPYQWTGDTWRSLPAGDTDIGVGADWIVWCISNDSGATDHTVCAWNGRLWLETGAKGVAVSVDPDGSAWIVTSDGALVVEQFH
jgi:tetratricopeptide (TPR) repeat protein